MNASFGVTFFGALFAIMNPLVTLPLFLSLTSDQSAADQRQTALSVMFYAAVMCAVIALAGRVILDFFGVGVDDFRVAGGLVLAGIALNMLSGAGNPAHEGGRAEGVQTRPTASVAFYPLTFPMVVGPGTITTLLVFGQQATGTTEHIVFAVVVALMLALLGIVLWFAPVIGVHLSATLRVIMSRLMGMILLAISVAMMAAGLKALFPGLA